MEIDLVEARESIKELHRSVNSDRQSKSILVNEIATVKDNNYNLKHMLDEERNVAFKCMAGVCIYI